ncbi:GNAT family N-acetyltransferase [Paenibacillus shunpengii]|uniref:GNAT family N-acetyltransferase n=1 Tax=Paenibacillus shunpengii TaxID=2054424 RepID=A0ABW5SLB3_9BACL
MKEIKILKIDRLEVHEIRQLVESSQNEGFRHLSRLVNEYITGINTFSQEGEALFIAVYRSECIGICGLNQETSIKSEIGRIRRLYVKPEYRNKGIGRELLNAVVKFGEPYYKRLVLKTDNEKASAFYKVHGFKETDGVDNQSHYMNLGASWGKQEGQDLQ